MTYSIQTLVCGAYQENAYLILPEVGDECFIIDPGDDVELLRSAIRQSGRKLCAILLTHMHFDHMLGAESLIADSGAKLYAYGPDALHLNDTYYNRYNEEVSVQRAPETLAPLPLAESLGLCGVHFKLLPTPGHTEGSVCFYDEENARLFSGDTLFCAGFGRTDLPTGSTAQLRRSLLFLLKNLPEQTHVYPGHGCETCISEERRRYRL